MVQCEILALHVLGGVLWDGDDGVKLAQRLSNSEHFKFMGLYAHEGQSYHARGVQEIQEIGDQTAERVLQLAGRYGYIEQVLGGLGKYAFIY